MSIDGEIDEPWKNSCSLRSFGSPPTHPPTWFPTLPGKQAVSVSMAATATCSSASNSPASRKDVAAEALGGATGGLGWGARAEALTALLADPLAVNPVSPGGATSGVAGLPRASLRRSMSGGKRPCSLARRRLAGLPEEEGGQSRKTRR